MNAEPGPRRRRRVARAGRRRCRPGLVPRRAPPAVTPRRRTRSRRRTASTPTSARSPCAAWPSTPPSGTSYQRGSERASCRSCSSTTARAADRLTAISSSAVTGWSAYPTTAAADQVAGAAAGTSTSGGSQVVSDPAHGGAHLLRRPGRHRRPGAARHQGHDLPGHDRAHELHLRPRGHRHRAVPVRLADARRRRPWPGCPAPAAAERLTVRR